MQFTIHLFLLARHLFHSLVSLLQSQLFFIFASDEQMDGNTQMFVPFCCEVSLSEVDNFDNSDSDCEPDRHGSKTLSPTSRQPNRFYFEKLTKSSILVLSISIQQSTIIPLVPLIILKNFNFVSIIGQKIKIQNKTQKKR